MSSAGAALALGFLSLYESAAAILLFLLASSTVALCAREFDGDFLKPSFFFLAKFFVFYSLAGFVFLAATPRDLPDQFPEALGYCLAALLSFYIAFRSRAGVALGNRLPLIRSRWTRRNVVLGCAASLTLGLTAYYLLVYVNGGFVNYISHLYNRTRLIQGWGPLRLIVDFVGLSVSISYLATLSFYRRSPLAKGAFALLLSAWLIISLTLGGRGFILWQLLILFFLHQQIVGKLRTRTVALASLALFVLFVLLGELRQQIPTLLTGQKNIAIEAAQQNIQIPTIFDRNFPFLQTFIGIIQVVPDRYDYYYGATYLEALTAVVPRQLWPEKPFGVASEVNYLLQGSRFYDSQNLSDIQSGADVRLLDEAYLNFGLPGVLLVFSALGLVTRCYQTYLRRAKSDKISVLLSAWAAPLVLYYLDGSSFSTVLRLAELALIGLFLFVVFRARLVLGRAARLQPIGGGARSRTPHSRQPPLQPGHNASEPPPA